MWTRKELKTKSKIRVKGNYWKAVLAGLVLVFAAESLGSINSIVEKFNDNQEEAEDAERAEQIKELERLETSLSERIAVLDAKETEGEEVVETVETVEEADTEKAGLEEVYKEMTVDHTVMMAAIFGIMAYVIMVIVVVAIPLRILVFNPLEIGCRRFFVKNLKEDAQIKEMCYAFDNGYKRNVKTMFFRDVYTFLWTLLLIFPGIIKMYEYQMIPYILAEYPEMDQKDVFALSRQMMDGNKWKAFLLDLSFFGWYFLNGMTFGILGVFYVNPYQAQTDAALYETLKEQ